MPLQLSFDAIGNGPPVLILHGLFGSSRTWSGIARQLAERHRVFCVDLRNHGRSPWSESMDYHAMADDLRMLIGAQRMQQPVVIGQGIGGKTAMALALASPDAIGGLVLVDVAPVSYVKRLAPLFDAMRKAEIDAPMTREQTRRSAEQIADVAEVEALMRKLNMREEHFDWRLNLAAISDSLDTLCGFPPELLLQRYAGNCLLIHGSASEFVREQDLIALADLFPQLQIAKVDDVGHWLHTDKPEQFLRELARLPAFARQDQPS